MHPISIKAHPKATYASTVIDITVVPAVIVKVVPYQLAKKEGDGKIAI